MSKLIVILGISGKQGGSIARSFLQDPTWLVRGISRNPSSPACQELISQGAEIFSGSVSSKEFLITALQGAHTIFATTDFWSTYRDPNATSQVAEGQTLNQYSFETEVQQGKNIAEAASKIKTLELFIWSDLVSVRDTSGGKWTWAYHFDSKAEVEKYIKAELPNLSAKTSYFIPGAYVANLERFWKPAKQSDGRYLLQQPGSGNIPFYWIDTVHDSGLFVKALTELAHGQKLLGYGSKMSLKEAIKLWGEVKGVDARFEEVPLEAWGSDWPDQGIRREIAEMMMFMGEYDYAPKEDPTLVLASDLGLDVKARSLKEAISYLT